MSAEDKKKLTWRCRRGTRELDRMTRHYLDRHYDRADDEHRRAFANLLELPDPQLHSVLVGATAAPDPATADVARLIRNRLP